MIVAVADTHAAIWYLFSDPRLGKTASAFIEDTIANGNYIGVSAITLAEMVYLVEKERIPANTLIDLHAALADPKSVLRHIPLDESVAMKMAEVSRKDIPDLPDRIIAATAQLRGIPVLSRDSRIRSSTITTIW
jgi:PIN domain nuclease of toxin-antitoxin system